LPSERIVDTMIMVHSRVWAVRVSDITRSNSISLEEGSIIGARPVISLSLSAYYWDVPKRFDFSLALVLIVELELVAQNTP
jgi:hypothetical protein